MYAPSGALSSTMVALSNTLAASGFSILTRNKYYMVYVISMCDMNKIGCAVICMPNMYRLLGMHFVFY